MSGKVAEKILRDNGIPDVQVISVPGQLTDHYNPVNKTVEFIRRSLYAENAAAAAVAAHEWSCCTTCGWLFYVTASF